MDKILIIGAGGHAKVVIEVLKLCHPHADLCCFDDNVETWGGQVLGVPIVGGAETLADSIKSQCFIVAIGDNQKRAEKQRQLIHLGGVPITAAHPSAVISQSAEVGQGVLIMPNVVVNALAQIGDAVILNTSSVIEHDCSVGDGAHLGPNSTICGGVTIGERTLLGAGSTVIPCQSVGSDAVIGAGSTVVNSVSSGSVVVGTPAKEVGKH